jgi:hypothetical protein
MKFPLPSFTAALILVGSFATADEIAFTEKKGSGEIEVSVGGQPFANYLYEGHAKPVIYPILGPGGIPMTRNFPFKEVEGEAKDHPHHQSFWYTHGDVNGISFWHLGKDAGLIETRKIEQKGASILSENEWKAPGGKVVLTDARTVTFSELPGGERAIDFEITLKASHGEVTFGDTKEGSMGIRTNSQLRVKPVGKNAPAHAINSAGDKDGSVWGKNAAWVAYWGKIDGKPAGIAIFDHPKNPRYPTTWHARDYGLVAANPFGLHDFQKKPKGAGNLAIKDGESATFRYRFVFYAGENADNVAALWNDWSGK